jgi:hypothetical protein
MYLARKTSPVRSALPGSLRRIAEEMPAMPSMIFRTLRPVSLALASAGLLTLGACAGSPTANPDMVSIVPGPSVPSGTKGPKGEPLCRDVGGYEAYYKKTDKACWMCPDAFIDINYNDPGGPFI